MTRTQLLALPALTLLLLAGACKKSAPPPVPVADEAAIRARYTQMMTSLCQDSFTNAVAVADPETQANEGKMKLIYGAGRLLIGLGQHQPEDFRVDRVELGPNGTNAQVFTSVRRGGKWEPDAKPGTWLCHSNLWYARF